MARMRMNDISDAMSFWHGGNLDIEKDSHKKGRWEYGPGLYLITKYSVAQKYARGNRKLYRVDVERGNASNNTYIPTENVLSFVKSNAIRAKQRDVMQVIQDRNKDGKILSDIVINVLINFEALQSTKASLFRKFLVDNGVDYTIVDRPFGWGDSTMMVLYNMKKITLKKQITAKDKIEVFDL